jgi:hypothetical protein
MGEYINEGSTVGKEKKIVYPLRPLKGEPGRLRRFEAYTE